MRVFWLLILSFLSASVCSAKPTDRSIPTIGVITDLSGPAAYWGIQTQLGAQIAAKELETDGLKVKLVFEDHQLNTVKSVTGTQKLINIDHVDAIYSDFTATSVAASAVSKTHKKLFLYGAAAASPVRSNPYAFKTYLDYFVGCRRISNFWKKSGLKVVGVLKATAEFGEICADGAREVFPDLKEVIYHYGEDVSTQVLLLKKKGVEAILNVTYEPDMLRMMKSMATINFYPHIGANEDAITKVTRQEYPDSVAQATLFGFFDISQDFLNKVIKASPDNDMVAVEAAALAYIHVRQLREVVSACKPGDVSCHISTLSSSPRDEEVLSFRGWKDRIATFDVALKNWDEGELKYIE